MRSWSSPSWVCADERTPQSWHHGLMARWWAEYNHADPDELAYYRGAIERFGQPALDLACGAGRLLVPLLEGGLDVDGVDISYDMLARAKELVQARGVRQPSLHAQAMHELDQPRRYRTIYICDSFRLGGYRDQDREALRRIHDHLEPGGALIFSHDFPYDDVDDWSRWLPGHRGDYPGLWPGEGTSRPLPDGDELELMIRGWDFDPLLQRKSLEMRMRQWHGDAIVAEETRLLHENLCFAQQVLLMLRDAGFADALIEGRYTGVPATPDDASVVFVAVRGT